MKLLFTCITGWSQVCQWKHISCYDIIMKSVGQLICKFNIIISCYIWTLFNRTRHMITLNLIGLNCSPSRCVYQYTTKLHKMRTRPIRKCWQWENEQVSDQDDFWKNGIWHWRMLLNQVMNSTGLMSLNWFNVTEVGWLTGCFHWDVFLSPAAPKAWDGRYCNTPRPSVRLSVRPSITFSFRIRTVTQKRIDVFSRNFAGTCTMSGGVLYSLWYWWNVVWIFYDFFKYWKK